MPNSTNEPMHNLGNGTFQNLNPCNGTLQNQIEDMLHQLRQLMATHAGEDVHSFNARNGTAFTQEYFDDKSLQEQQYHQLMHLYHQYMELQSGFVEQKGLAERQMASSSSMGPMVNAVGPMPMHISNAMGVHPMHQQGSGYQMNQQGGMHPTSAMYQQGQPFIPNADDLKKDTHEVAMLCGQLVSLFDGAIERMNSQVGYYHQPAAPGKWFLSSKPGDLYHPTSMESHLVDMKRSEMGSERANLDTAAQPVEPLWIDDVWKEV